MPQAGAAGNGVHIGIFDAACRLNDTLTTDHRVNQGDEYSFINTAENITHPHGGYVFERAASYAPAAEITLYQTVKEDRKLPLGAYSDAITHAIDDGVDIVNISSGDPWRGPIRHNPNIQETERLIESGITVVAAAGNHNPKKYDSRPPVHCPSAKDEVISVGGLVTECPRDPGDESAAERRGPYYLQNEQATVDADISSVDGAFCDEGGCVGGEGCLPTQTEIPWEWNPLPTGSKPDVLAPMHTIKFDGQGEPFIGHGTSFAAPLVTGSLACIFSELNQMGKEIPPPHEVRNAVRTGCLEISGSQLGKYNAMGVREGLSII